MSDYQTVVVHHRSGRTVQIEVREEHPDMPVFADLLEVDEHDEDLVKIAAMLLFDEKARIGDVEPPDDEPLPEHFVDSVRVVESVELDVPSSESLPLYQVTLEVRLVRDQDAKLFEIGDEFTAAASVDGDFEDMFA